MRKAVPPGLRWRAYLLTGVLCVCMVQISLAVQRATHNRGLTLLTVVIATVVGLLVLTAAQRRWVKRLGP